LHSEEGRRPNLGPGAYSQDFYKEGGTQRWGDRRSRAPSEARRSEAPECRREWGMERGTV